MKYNTSSKKSLDNLRDCVRKAFFDGCERGHEFSNMRHAIIVEFKRLGYDSSEIKDKLLEWNKRCERPLGINEQRRQLLNYVDWTDKHECKIGCKGLEDYCLGKENCEFYKKTRYRNRLQTKDLPFNIQELEKFLTERFKADAYSMMLVVKTLRYVQQEKATGEVILIGYRGISSSIRDRYKHMPTPMDIFRKMSLLIDEGIVEIAVRGKSGEFRGQANGYRFLSWKPP